MANDERPSGTAASDVDAASAVAGNAGVTADQATSQTETAMDVNQAEATIASIVEGITKSQDLTSVLQGTLAGYLSLGLCCVANSIGLANRTNHDGQACSNAQNQNK